MQRLIAIVAGFAFAGAAFQGATLHTHAYLEHEHPEHHHGPAAHEHPRPADHHDDDGDEDRQAPHLEPCEPGQHAVSMTVACPSIPRVDAFDAASTHTAAVGGLVLLRSAHTVTDVRVHGPPSRTQAPPRAPPLIFPS